MIQWFAEIGVHLLVIALIFLGSLALVAWGLFGDRGKGRARCPHCWYDMRGRTPDREGLVCPECGHDAQRERRLFKDHRRWQAILIGAALALPCGYLLSVVAGWCREQPVVRTFEKKSRKAFILTPGWACRSQIDVEPVGPQWLVHRLPPSLARYFDRSVKLTLNAVSVLPEDLALLGKLRHLREIELCGSQVDEAGLAHLKNIRSLECLNLGYTGITDAGLAHLAGLTRLKRLSLEEGWKFTDEGLIHLQGLTNLESLNLSVRAVTDAGLVHIEGLTHLRQLDLSGSKVTDAGLAHLKGLEQLEELHVEDTKVTKAGVAELKQALPNLRIYR